jgi:hypothetical protein
VSEPQEFEAVVFATGDLVISSDSVRRDTWGDLASGE